MLVLVGVVVVVVEFVVFVVLGVGRAIDGSGLKPVCDPPTSPRPRFDISSLVIRLLPISHWSRSFASGLTDPSDIVNNLSIPSYRTRYSLD